MRSLFYIFILLLSAFSTGCNFTSSEEIDCKKRLESKRPPPFDCAEYASKLAAEGEQMTLTCKANELYSPRALWDMCKSEYGSKYSEPSEVNQTVTMQSNNAVQAPSSTSAVKVPVDLNRGLPSMIDSQTMLTKVEIEGVFTNYYLKMINFNANQLNNKFLIDSQETVGRRNCSDRDIKVMYDNGYIMRYIVSGSDNKQVGSFVLSKHYCERLTSKVE